MSNDSVDKAMVFHSGTNFDTQSLQSSPICPNSAPSFEDKSLEIKDSLEDCCLENLSWNFAMCVMEIGRRGGRKGSV